jgi:ankyrin repeat protein
MGMTYSEDQKRLIAAARSGDIEVLSSLIKQGFDIDCELKYGATALMLAAARGQEEAVSLLVRAGAKVNRRNRFGATPLLEASDKGHTSVVKLLVDMGAEINLPHNNGNTALLMATIRRDRKTIKTLLELGADPEQKNFDGWSAKRWAEAESDLAIRSMLGIKKGEQESMVSQSVEKAEPSASKGNTGVVQGAFWTALMRAASTGDLETVRRLALDGVEINAQSPNGTTPLMAAVKNGHSETAFELIELGADLSIADADGMTAVEWARKKGQAIIVKGLEQLSSKDPADREEGDQSAKPEATVVQ